MKRSLNKTENALKVPLVQVIISRQLIFAICVFDLVRRITQGDRISVYLLIAVLVLSALSGYRAFQDRLKDGQNTAEIELKTAHNSQLMGQLGEVDTQTRREIGAWLHSVVQPKLLSIARKAWTSKTEVGDLLGAAIDELNEEVVRRYSHQLFPVQLEIALVLALADLLKGRAEFKFDQRMFPLMGDVGEAKSVPRISQENVGSLIPRDQVFFPVSQRYAIYRIIEEAVANAEKKPSTTKITVDISIPQDQIIITVTDNGSPKNDSVAPGLGSRLIDTYTVLNGGAWALSNIDGGVQFRCELPIIVATEAAPQ